MRRIQTARVPGQPETPDRPFWWDFRRQDAGWTLELPTARSRQGQVFSRPEQAAWLAGLGLAFSPVLGPVTLDEAAVQRIIAALEPVGPSWAAHEALDALEQAIGAGDLEAAVAHSETLRDLAPEWVVGRRRRLNLLIQGVRDPDAATADIASIPPGLLPADELRRERQTVALLRDDWVAYATAQEEMVRDGARQVWSWETLGLAWWGAGDMQRSLQAFREALIDHPGHRELTLREIEVLDVLGHTLEAIGRLDALDAAGPPHGKTLALRGWMRRRSDPATALADYEAALAVDPDQPIARVGRGIQRLEAGDLAAARADIAPFSHCGWTEAAHAFARLRAAEG